MLDQPKGSAVMEQQKRTVAPPIDTDRESLADFASVIQSNLEDIFVLAHAHAVRTTAPEANEGNVGDIVLVNLAGLDYLYCKVSADTWKRTASLS